MRVITEYPVYIDKKLIGGEDFLSANGAETQAAQTKKGKPASPNAEVAAAQGKQGVLDKVVDALGLTDDKATATPDKKGMSKTVKYVLIGVGVLAVLGLGYALLKKK